MKLTKIHRVLRSKQSDWTKEYIDFNTEKRTNAANSFEKDFSKLRINSVYGKAMKKKQKRFFKIHQQTNSYSHKIFDKKYDATIHEIKPVLTLNKPIYIGFTVLELSKWLMYDFHYSFIKKHFDGELLFTDTQSYL